MDRNRSLMLDCGIFDQVALRKESVDRNGRCAELPAQMGVALRKESVDRNLLNSVKNAHDKYVALRKESVDRNAYGRQRFLVRSQSLSARRAWIEINSCPISCTGAPRRSPQGERG